MYINVHTINYILSYCKYIINICMIDQSFVLLCTYEL